jgi:hypothetical protein
MSIFCCKRVSVLGCRDMSFETRSGHISLFILCMSQLWVFFHVVDLLARRALATAQIRMGSHAS